VQVRQKGTRCVLLFHTTNKIITLTMAATFSFASNLFFLKKGTRAQGVAFDLQMKNV
jgi:hypothetical protein